MYTKYCLLPVYKHLPYFHGHLFIYCRRHTLYQCGDLDKFTETVITKVESLPVEKVADVLNGFLERYGSSEVGYHSDLFGWSSLLNGLFFFLQSSLYSALSPPLVWTFTDHTNVTVTSTLSYRGDFKIMDASNKVEVSVIQNLYEACERILELISEKKHKRIIYCWILWGMFWCA